MIYSDSELIAWWNSLSGFDKQDLFTRILTVTDPDEGNSYWAVIVDFKRKADAHEPLTPKQLSILKRWER